MLNECRATSSSAPICVSLQIDSEILVRTAFCFPAFSIPATVFLCGPTINGIGIPNLVLRCDNQCELALIPPDILVVCHVHPFPGQIGARPSCIDTQMLRSVQAEYGVPAVGLICTPDHYLGFFTGVRPVRVEVVGNGVDRVKQDVYRVSGLPGAGRAASIPYGRVMTGSERRKCNQNTVSKLPMGQDSNRDQ